MLNCIDLDLASSQAISYLRIAIYSCPSQGKQEVDTTATKKDGSKALSHMGRQRREAKAQLILGSLVDVKEKPNVALTLLYTEGSHHWM